MPIKILIFTLFITQSMFTKIFNKNGHNKAQNLQWLSDEHLIVADNLLDMEFYKNYSLEDLTIIYGGVEYKEEWKDIIGYEGLYKISSFGRVKSMERQTGFIMNKYPRFKKETIKKCGENKKIGYMQYILCKDSVQRTFLSHRLVAIHFIPNPENKPQVNHINSKRDDNFVCNLEWCTVSENHLHAYRVNGRIPPKGMTGKFGRKTNNQVIYQFTKEGVFIKEWSSISLASNELKICNVNISSTSLNKRGTAGGFIWKKEK